MVLSETRAWKLLMRSPLHVSEQGVGLEETLEHIPSDSLFSALVVTWLEMAEPSRAVPQLFAEMQGSAPLRVTSAFPFAGDILFLPKPHLLRSPGIESKERSAEDLTANNHIENSPTENSGKKYKKVRWVSASIFEKLCDGISQEALNHLWNEHTQDKRSIQNGTVWVTPAEKEYLRKIVEPDEEDALHLWNDQVSPKVTIDRIANASALFHVGRLHFAPGCGLWLMAEGTEEWLERCTDALRILADSGIGGQRSRGNGQFTLQPIASPDFLRTQGQTDYVCLLSRFAPRPDELELLRKDQSSYQLVTVGGFHGTPWEKPVVRKQVRLVTEGSIIGACDHRPGKLVDVTPDQVTVGHPIYRNGYGFAVPIRLNSMEGES